MPALLLFGYGVFWIRLVRGTLEPPEFYSYVPASSAGRLAIIVLIFINNFLELLFLGTDIPIVGDTFPPSASVPARRVI